MAWAETQSPSFSARHDARLSDEAKQTLYELEGFRSQLPQRRMPASNAPAHSVVGTSPRGFWACCQRSRRPRAGARAS